MSARSLADAIRPSVSRSSGVAKRTALAIVWRCRNFSLSGGDSSGFALSWRHFDEEAQNIVVTNSQSLDAGLGDVPGLEFRHHFAAVVTQCACRIEIGVVALPDETTVTAQQRRIIDERGLERV